MFDFLKEVVSRVPDYSHGHSDAGGEDRAISKRRLEEKFLFFLPFSLTLIYIYIYIYLYYWLLHVHLLGLGPVTSPSTLLFKGEEGAI